jgi:ethanolamine phosphate transferase 2 subunit G
MGHVPLMLTSSRSQDRTRISLFPGVYSVLLIVSSRYVRRWNQTGQKFAGEPSISTSFYAGHTLTFWILLLTTYADVCRRLRREVFSWGSHSLSIVLATALTSCAFLFKVAFTFADAPELFRGIPALTPLVAPIRGSYLTPLARLIFVSLALSLVATGVLSPKMVTKDHHPQHVLLSLLLLTQSRATNIPLFLMASIQLHCLKKILSSGAEARTPVLAITTSSLILQHAFFFASGGSNAISSVDLSSAYNGVRGYNVLVVAVLTFVSNWAGPIWWVSGAGVLFDECRRKTTSHSQTENQPTVGRVAMTRRGLGLQYIALTTLFTSMALLGVMVACTVLRTHLFIWTVFSPKYLYSMAWGLGQHLLVNIAGGLAFDSWGLGPAED